MRELIRRYVAIMFIIGSAIMIFVHLILDFSIARAQQKDMFDSTMHQIVDIIKANEYERARFERELHEDYVIKARAVAYILATSDNPEIYSLDELTKIAKSLEIDEINIFDEKGYVIASCKEENIGYHINENEKSQEFLPLLYSNDEDDYYIQSIEDDIDNAQMEYIGVNSKNTQGFIQIGLVPERIISYREKTSIASIFNRSALELAKIMILDEEGNVLGASSNMYEDFKRESKKVYQELKEEHHKAITINGISYYSVSMDYEDYLIVGATDIKYLYDDIQWHILSIITAMILACILGIIIFDKLIDKNIISNMRDITEVIKKIENGNFNVRIEEKGCLEFLDIERAINNMIDVLIHMSNRLEKVVISTNLPIGLFEYMTSLNQLLITNNSKEILAINDYEWNAIKNNPELCKKLFLEIKQTPVNGEEQVYLFNNKFIRLNLIIEDTGYFGFIEDVTTDMIKKDTMLNELKIAQIKSKVDALTGLLNKGAITNIVTEYAKKNNHGTLILFDLDNFKSVNDKKGHPEGDRLLKLFANTIKDLFRMDDYVARFGGDEFAVFICKELSDEELTEKLDKVINKVRTALKEYYTEFHVSVSIGASRLSKDINSFEELYEIADQHLYKAKHSGKDNYFIE